MDEVLFRPAMVLGLRRKQLKKKHVEIQKQPHFSNRGMIRSLPTYQFIFVTQIPCDLLLFVVLASRSHLPCMWIVDDRSTFAKDLWLVASGFLPGQLQRRQLLLGSADGCDML